MRIGRRIGLTRIKLITRDFAQIIRALRGDDFSGS
jgi:hypothetical protein